MRPSTATRRSRELASSSVISLDSLSQVRFGRKRDAVEVVGRYPFRRIDLVSDEARREHFKPGRIVGDETADRSPADVVAAQKRSRSQSAGDIFSTLLTRVNHLDLRADDLLNQILENRI